jgi:hypothetical protein
MDQQQEEASSPPRRKLSAAERMAVLKDFDDGGTCASVLCTDGSLRELTKSEIGESVMDLFIRVNKERQCTDSEIDLDFEQRAESTTCDATNIKMEVGGNKYLCTYEIGSDKLMFFTLSGHEWKSNISDL